MSVPIEFIIVCNVATPALATDDEFPTLRVVRCHLLKIADDFLYSTTRFPLKQVCPFSFRTPHFFDRLAMSYRAFAPKGGWLVLG
jgi:hypothetical protein